MKRDQRCKIPVESLPLLGLIPAQPRSFDLRCAGVRFISRRAAKVSVNTETAEFYIIAPEALYNLLQSEEWRGWADALWDKVRPPYNESDAVENMERLILEHGGSVILTGGDGEWEFEIPGESVTVKSASRDGLSLSPSQKLLELPDAKIHYRVKKSRDGILVKVYAGTRKIGFMDAYPVSTRRGLFCQEDVDHIIAKYPQWADTLNSIPILSVYGAFLNVEEFKGRGIGRAMYLACMREWFDSIGPFLFASMFCHTGIGGSTSGDAQRVWKSLARDFPSSGMVLGVLERPIMPSSLTKTAKYKSKKKIKTKDGDDLTVYEYSDRQIANRHREKADRIEKLRKSIDGLRKQVKKDLDSKDEKVALTALAVGLMDETFERIGNEDSAEEGHFGVTGWTVEHITFSKGKATIKYTGKSGVDHTKEVKDSALIKALKKAVKGKGKEQCIFDCEDLSVKADDVNAYLKEFDVTAKDIRGLHANLEVQKALKSIRSEGKKLPEDKKEREKILKDEFKKAVDMAAEAVGHEPSTLKNQYLVPWMEEDYLDDGEVNQSLNKKGAKSTPTLYDALRTFSEKVGISWALHGLGLDDDKYAPDVLNWTKALVSLKGKSKEILSKYVKKVQFSTARGSEDASWDGRSHRLVLVVGKGQKTDTSVLKYYLIHELGHALEGALGLTLNAFDATPYGQPPFISDYAEKNASEDFAETFVHLQLSPAELKSKAPDKYKDMKSRIASRQVKATYSPEDRYYRWTPDTTVEDVIARWQEDRGRAPSGRPYPRQKVTDNSMPAFYHPRDLWPYREYTWTRSKSREGYARDSNGADVYLSGPEKWDLLLEDLKRNGWDPSDPLHFQIGQQSGAKVGEGNHRLALAMALNLSRVPVEFHFQSGRVVKDSEPEEPVFVDVPPDVVEEVVGGEELQEEDQELLDDIMRSFRFGRIRRLAIIHINNAYPKAKDFEEKSLTGREGLLSSLTALEWALVNDMIVSERPIQKVKGKYTFEGYEADKGAVEELIAAGYLEVDGSEVKLSWKLEGKLRLYKMALKLATKATGEREDEHFDEQVKPDSEYKPPREDKRKRRYTDKDPDLEDVGGAEKDPDLSLNYKGRSASRTRRAKRSSSDDEQEGERVWETPKGGISARNPEGEVRTFYGDSAEESAELWASGEMKQEDLDDDESDSNDPEGEEDDWDKDIHQRMEDIAGTESHQDLIDQIDESRQGEIDSILQELEDKQDALFEEHGKALDALYASDEEPSVESLEELNDGFMKALDGLMEEKGERLRALVDGEDGDGDYLDPSKQWEESYQKIVGDMLSEDRLGKITPVITPQGSKVLKGLVDDVSRKARQIQEEYEKKSKEIESKDLDELDSDNKRKSLIQNLLTKLERLKGEFQKDIGELKRDHAIPSKQWEESYQKIVGDMLSEDRLGKITPVITPQGSKVLKGLVDDVSRKARQIQEEYEKKSKEIESKDLDELDSDNKRKSLIQNLLTKLERLKGEFQKDIGELKRDHAIPFKDLEEFKQLAKVEGESTEASEGEESGDSVGILVKNLHRVPPDLQQDALNYVSILNGGEEVKDRKRVVTPAQPPLWKSLIQSKVAEPETLMSLLRGSRVDRMTLSEALREPRRFHDFFSQREDFRSFAEVIDQKDPVTGQNMLSKESQEVLREFALEILGDDLDLEKAGVQLQPVNKEDVKKMVEDVIAKGSPIGQELREALDVWRRELFRDRVDTSLRIDGEDLLRDADADAAMLLALSEGDPDLIQAEVREAS